MKTTPLRYISFFLFFFISFEAFSQEQDYISGRLLDAKTNEPVVFANIRIKDRAVGIITNVDGSFRIPLKYKEYGDILEISAMGYEIKELPIANFKQDELNILTINSSAISLQEVVVKAKAKRNRTLNAKQIVQRAIDAISRNFPPTPFSTIGYYRDYQLREQQYTNLNEALIKVFDKGFEVEDHTSLQFGLYNYKTNLDFEVDSFAAKPYDYQIRDKFIPNAEFTNRIVSNELVLLFNHDAIRNNSERTYSYVDIFVKDFIKQHDFFTYFLTNYGDKQVYKVKFEKSAVPFKVKGDIYIDVDTYAIRKLDYAVYRQKLDKASPATYSESEMDLLYEILVEYQNHKDHMYLSYISFHNKFKLIRPPEFFIEDVIFDPNTYEMIMVLNKPAANWLAMNKDDFEVYYEGYRLKVEKVVRVENLGDTYAISFHRKGKLQRKNLDVLFSNIDDKEKPSLKIIVSKMVDADGNLVAERKSELLDQFREFFTQKIISSGNNEVDRMSLVDKTMPLGHPVQLKIKVNLDEEFWMNTPLKRTKE